MAMDESMVPELSIVSLDCKLIVRRILRESSWQEKSPWSSSTRTRRGRFFIDDEPRLVAGQMIWNTDPRGIRSRRRPATPWTIESSGIEARTPDPLHLSL